MSDDESNGFGSLRSVNLTIVDFFGALVPGIVWLILLLILVHRILFGDFIFTGEFEFLRNVYKQPNAAVAQSAILAGIASIGLTVGYLVKAFAMEVAGFIESLAHSVIVFLFSWMDNIRKKYPDILAEKNLLKRFFGLRCGLRFPYPLLHENEDYYAYLKEFIYFHSNLKSDKLPKNDVFSYCKRMIRVTCPNLWQESMQLEAEVRMMGSLFLASFLATFLAFWAASSGTQSESLFKWLGMLSCIAIVILGRAFSIRRKEEVCYTYLNSILVAKGVKPRPQK